MTATHQVVASFLERAQRRYQDDVAAAMARYRASEMAAQRQCGAEPGHIFAALVGPGPGLEHQDGRPQLACVICRIPRRFVTGDAPNQPPREITS